MTNENKYMCVCGRPASFVYIKLGKVSCDTCTVELDQSIAPLGAGFDPPTADDLRRCVPLNPFAAVTKLFPKAGK